MAMFAIGIAILGFILFRYLYASVTATKETNQELNYQINELNLQLDALSAKEVKSRHEAEQAFEAKSKLLAAMSHEIRTPMNGIIGMANLLVETELNKEQKDYAQTVLDCSTNLLNNINEILIQDMLESAKVETLENEIEEIHFDVRNCIEEVFDAFATQAAEKNVDLLYQVNSSVPVQIDTDYKRLQKILINLVENALQRTNEGEVVLSVDGRPSETGDFLLVDFMVSDSGPKLSAEALKSIFVGSARDIESAEMADLALVICKRITDQLEGAISVENNKDAGATFTVSIPTIPTHNTLLDFVDSRLKEIEGKQVLIITPSLKAGHILSRELENWKLIPVFSDTLENAQQVLSQISIDAFLIDSHQVMQDGIEVALQIKKRCPESPVILLNSSTDERYKQYPDYFSSVISKPIKYGLLLDSLISVLRSNSEGTSSRHLIPEDFALKYPLRIIVAEDNPVNQKWITKILGKIGYKCEMAENGNEIMDKVSHERYDLILMDVQMPGMDGLEATKMIRLCLETQPVIIAMTANAMHGDREKCLESGMNDYIAKPVELPVLLSMLEKWAIFIREQKESNLQKFKV